MATFRNYPKFSGGFQSWRVTLQTDYNRGLQEDLLVFSSGKREAALNHLWLKFLWDQLSKDEFVLFILTLKDSDHKKVAFLKANLIIGRKELRRRLNILEFELGQKVSSRTRYQGSKSQRIEIQRVQRRLPKPKKYSGYVKNISSLGTKSRKTRFLETIDRRDVFLEEEFDWYSSLLKGFPSSQGLTNFQAGEI